MSVDLETSAVQCNYCGEPFEWGEDEGRMIFTVPVECAKGNFCSEAHRAQAMYEGQDAADRKVLRRFYLGARLVSGYAPAAETIMEGWGYDDITYEVADISCALSPEGGMGGKEGVEDDCEAKLMSPSAGKAIWDGLYEARILARQDVLRAERTLTLGTHLSPEYWEKQIADAKEQAAKIDAALVALEGLMVVVE